MIGSSASLFKGPSLGMTRIDKSIIAYNYKMDLVSPPDPIRIPKQLTAAEWDSKKHLKTCELSLFLFRSDTNFN